MLALIPDARRNRQPRRTNVPHPNPLPSWGEGIRKRASAYKDYRARDIRAFGFASVFADSSCAADVDPYPIALLMLRQFTLASMRSFFTRCL